MGRLTRVVIIGAGDHGHGTLEILRACNRNENRYEIVGFLDDHPGRQRTEVAGLSVRGLIDSLDASDRTLQYIVAIADCRAKRDLVERLRPLNLAYVAVIHPGAIVAPDVEVVGGSIICAGVAVAYNTRICEHVTINLNATVGHDCVVGPLSTVAPGANIAGKVRLGEGCDVGPNATLVKGINVGPWVSIGPGTVVLKDLAPNSRVFGNPARAVPA